MNCSGQPRATRLFLPRGQGRFIQSSHGRPNQPLGQERTIYPPSEGGGFEPPKKLPTREDEYNVATFNPNVATHDLNTATLVFIIYSSISFLPYFTFFSSSPPPKKK